MRPWAIVLSSVLVGGMAALWLFVRSGAYDVAAATAHWQATYSFLESVMEHSVRRRAPPAPPPAASAEEAAATLRRGAACFAQHCVLCHGAPGLAPASMALAMQPLPGSLVDAARRWDEAELYWIVRNGIRMSGMPAWQHRLADDDLWAVAKFVDRLAELSPQAYAQVQTQAAGPVCAIGAAPSQPSPPSVERGRAALRAYACHGCHVIDGVVGSTVAVGPPLGGLASRALIAARLPNTPDNLVRWIRSPQHVKPGSAMPSLGVGEADARDMAAYLATLR